MTADAVSVISFLFSSIWSLFVSFEIPGTHATPAEFMLFALWFVLALRIIKRVFLASSGGGDEE